MTRNRDDRDDSKLIEALRSGRTVEPELTPARLELERRRLMARLTDRRAVPSRVWRPVLAGGLVGVAAVAAAAVLLIMFVVGSTQDKVTLAGVWRLEGDDAIARGAPVEIPEGVRARLILKDGTEIWAGPGTSMTVERTDGSRIRLESGHLVAQVTPRDDENRFEIVTGEATVTVLGTFFSVRAREGRTAVALHRGKVRLRSDDQVVSVEPGHQVIAGARGIVSLDLTSPEDTEADVHLARREEAASSPIPAIDGQGEVSIGDSVGSVPASDYDNGDIISLEPTSTVAEIEVAPAPGVGHAASSKGSGRVLKEDANLEQLWNARRYEEIVRVTQEAGLDSDVLFVRGKALAGLGRWNDAGETFGAVAGMSPSLRPEALYLSARSYSRARAFDRSLDMAQLAIRVGGPNADHAWRIKFGALSALGRYEEAATAAQEYQRDYPGGAHVKEARFVTATGLRISQRWEEASDFYAGYLTGGNGSGAMGDDAAFYLGYCMIRAGRDSEGRRHLENYIEQYPNGRHTAQASKLVPR